MKKLAVSFPLWHCFLMSTPPLPSAPLAARLAWLAAEVRAEKDEAGMIAAAIAELFARLITGLAGLAARLKAGALPQMRPWDTHSLATPAVAPVVPGLLPRVFGWLGGLLPLGGAMAPTPDMTFRSTAPPWTQSASTRGSAQPRAATAADGPEDLDRGGADADAAILISGGERDLVARLALTPPAWVAARLAAWRGLPAATAGPCFQIAHGQEG